MSTAMTFDPNDPRWTAYAFDELNASERAAADAEVQTNADAQQFVTELRRTAEILRTVLKAEAMPALGKQKLQANIDMAGEPITAATQPVVDATEQRKTVVRALPPEQRSSIRREWIWLGIGSTVAAAIVVAVVLPAINPAREAVTRNA